MKKIIIVISILILVACSETKIVEDKDERVDYATNAIEQANWFLGTWENNTNAGSFTEKWEQKNDSVYIGESYITLDDKIMFYERISLEKKKMDWYYKVSVKSKNNEQPIPFKLISLSPHQLVFENPQHDFPTKITYTKIREDSIVAEISGKIKGVEEKELFPMKKIKSNK